MHTSERGLGRIVSFSDGVVAISMTLLVLPLTDISAAAYGGDVVALLRANSSALLAFVISFAVVARYWLAHHRLFSRVSGSDPALVALNLVWLFAIVFLPFPTALVEGTTVQSGTGVFYLASLLVASLLTRALGAYVARHPELTDCAPTAADRTADLVAWLTMAVLVVLALVMLVAPDWGMASLWILFLVGPAVHLWRRITSRSIEPA